jgi:hypothetical protein
MLKKMMDHLMSKIYKQDMNITANIIEMLFNLTWKHKLIKWLKKKNLPPNLKLKSIVIS